MKMARKKKLENLKKKHYQYIKSLGVNIDIDSGKIKVVLKVICIYLSCPSLSTSDNISGTTTKRSTLTLFLKVRQ